MDLHNVSVISRPLYHWTYPVKSPRAGIAHGDTLPWDYLPQVLGHADISSFRIAEVHAIYNQCVVGLRVVYEINSKRVDIDHFGSERHTLVTLQES
jgi:hypothetical protein